MSGTLVTGALRYDYAKVSNSLRSRTNYSRAELQNRNILNQRLDRLLQESVENDMRGFSVVYQPQVNLATGEVDNLTDGTDNLTDGEIELVLDDGNFP